MSDRLFEHSSGGASGGSAGSGRRLVVEADGGSRGNPGRAAYGAVVRDPDSGDLLARAAERIGTATNNVAEYNGLIAGLKLARELARAALSTVRQLSRSMSAAVCLVRPESTTRSASRASAKEIPRRPQVFVPISLCLAKLFTDYSHTPFDQGFFRRRQGSIAGNMRQKIWQRGQACASTEVLPPIERLRPKWRNPDAASGVGFRRNLAGDIKLSDSDRHEEILSVSGDEVKPANR